ncbi:MAG TPA: hypothetical protein DEB40_02155 [Elusimicrobia bacterium]|nr:hypothetical protein [Elusimicrobiota bacterium]HBT60534.1 hypothetical protein [Elusimicrobiota bacterium]
MNRNALKRSLTGLWSGLIDLFGDDDPNEPFYDPVHLGAVAIVCMVIIGSLYWLLWTLLVYEGGLFPKLGAVWAILAHGKTPRDFGYEAAPYAMGVFAGWMANAAALLICLFALALLWRLYRAASQAQTQA